MSRTYLQQRLLDARLEAMTPEQTIQSCARVMTAVHRGEVILTRDGPVLMTNIGQQAGLRHAWHKAMRVMP